MNIIKVTEVELIETNRVQYLKKSFLGIFDWYETVYSERLKTTMTVNTDREISQITITNPFGTKVIDI